VTSFELRIAVENICCITDEILDFFFGRHITRIETGMCIFVRHDELRRAVTSFEFRIAVENICCIIDEIIDFFNRHITRTNFALRRKIYVVLQM
jgi:hypothetical protein